MIFGLWRSRKDEARVLPIYSGIVAQARQPVFYAGLGVPDTLEGRYDMLMLHAWLYMRRLNGEDEPAREIARKVIDLMFDDMDTSLREMGVGDLSVPKKIKKMAQAFYGRASAYDTALDEGGDALAEAVRRNVFAGEGRAEDASALATYIHQAIAALAAQPTQDLVGGGPVFPTPEGQAA